MVIASDSMDEVKETNREHYFLNIRLIFYTRPTSGYVAPVTCLTSRVFLPLRTGLKAYENIGQTMERISAWLRVTGKMFSLTVLTSRSTKVYLKEFNP